MGSDSYNQALSERRASSVAEYLISQGLEPGKVTSQGRGESQPITDNESEEGRASTDGWSCTQLSGAGA